MTGKYRFLYIFVAIAICVSINIVFSGEVKAAGDDDTVVQSEGGTTDTGTTSEEGEEGPKTRPPGWDKGKKEGFADNEPRTPKPKASPSDE